MPTDFLIESIDFGNAQFKRSWKKLDAKILAEATERVCQLLRQTTFPPGLHAHQFKEVRVTSALDPNKKVPVWTMHITADDSHKVSFTVENKCAYFRACGSHSEIDKSP